MLFQLRLMVNQCCCYSLIDGRWCYTARDAFSSSSRAQMHMHRVLLLQSNRLSYICIFCDTSLTSKTLFCALPLALARLCTSQLPELNNDRRKEWKPVELLSCISFSLHSLYFPTKIVQALPFHCAAAEMLLLGSCQVSVSEGSQLCTKATNLYWYTDATTDINVAVNYLFPWDCRGQIYGPISAVFGKAIRQRRKWHELTSHWNAAVFSPKNQQTAKIDMPKLNISVYLAPAGRREINACALVQCEVPCRWTDGAD